MTANIVLKWNQPMKDKYYKMTYFSIQLGFLVKIKEILY